MIRTAAFHAMLRYAALLALVAFALYAAPSAQAQEKKVYRVGYLSGTAREAASPTRNAFLRGMKDAGYVEGENFVLEARYADGQDDRLQSLADELLHAKVDLIYTGSTVATLAAVKRTKTVPIVFAGLADPVGTGIVKSLGAPGGNASGVMQTPGHLLYTREWVDLLKEASPSIDHVAVLANTTSSANTTGSVTLQELRSAAAKRAVKVDVHQAGTAAELDAALAAIAASGAKGLIVTPDPLYNAHRDKLGQFGIEKRLPSVAFTTQLADAGALVSYGGSLIEANRRAASYVDRVLKGAKPAELPVQPVPVELVVNRKTANAIGVTLPESMVRRADRVID